MIKNILRCFFTFLTVISFITESESSVDSSKFKELVEQFNNKTNDQTFNPDRSGETYIFKKLEETKKELESLRSIDINKLSDKDQIDYKFIESILVGKEIEYEEIQSWKMDPRDYMNFRQISNKLNTSKSYEEIIEYLLKYLPVVLNDLKFAMQQIDTYVPRFQELGLFMAENSISIFRLTVSEFTYAYQEMNDWEEDIRINKIKKLNTEIRKQLESFIDFLKYDLPKKNKTSFSIGKETYNKMLKNQFLLNYDDETLWEFGLEEFNNTLNKMDIKYNQRRRFILE